MFTVLVAALALGAPPADAAAFAEAAAGTAAQPEKPARQRTTRELREAASEALRLTAGTWKTQPEEAAAVLLPVFEELKSARRMAKADREKYLFLLSRRLSRISEAISARLARQPSSSSGAGTALAEDGQLAALPGAPAAHGGRSAPDNGQELVELIQRTIAPDTWDVNGGLGTIMYYPPLRVLVIRQTGNVHGELEGVLGQLRR